MTHNIDYINEKPFVKWVLDNHKLRVSNNSNKWVCLPRINKLNFFQHWLRIECDIMVWVEPCGVAFKEFYFPKVESNTSKFRHLKPTHVYEDAMEKGLYHGLKLHKRRTEDDD